MVQGYSADFPASQLRASVLCQAHWSGWQDVLPAEQRFIAPSYGLNSFYAGADCALTCAQETTQAHLTLTGAGLLAQVCATRFAWPLLGYSTSRSMSERVNVCVALR